MVAYIRKLYDWMGTCVHSPYADFWLGFLFYVEAIFFLPTDPLLIIFCLEKREKSFVYATIATIASVIGGLTGYAIGYFLWNTIGQQIIHNHLLNYVLTPEKFCALSQLLKQNEWKTLLLAGIPPIPYKAVTLTAGFCQLSLLPFIVCSSIARGARFFIMAGIIHLYGDRIKHSIDKYFNIITAIIIIIVTTLVWFFI
jgi:membrane protein YqaA with SNARE-associated domain